MTQGFSLSLPTYRKLLPGDPAPWFVARSTSRERFKFDTVGGRYIVLCFFATADAKGRSAIAEVLEHTDVFDDNFASFFGVSLDPRDETQGRVSARLPGYRFFWDFTGEISKLYGAIPNDDNPRTEKTPLRRMWFVIDPTLRILKIVPFEQNGGDAKEVVNFVRSLPPPALYADLRFRPRFSFYQMYLSVSSVTS